MYLLSHFIDIETPLYGGENELVIRSKKAISRGDSSNSKTIFFPNHAGTHIDFPKHIDNQGKTINDYPPDFWFFYHPSICVHNAKESEIINLTPEAIAKIPSETDFLIIKTGFQRYRGKRIYWCNNPGLHPDLAGKLKSRCPNLRVVGSDIISISSYENRTIGRKAHRNFLIDYEILLVEDMNLVFMNSKIHNIICFPLLIDSIDGSPVTIVGY